MRSEKDRVTESLQKYIKKNQWAKAIQVLDRLAALEPMNAAHRLRAGDYYLKLGYSEKAATAYDQAADLFAKSGFVVKALAAYKMILRLDPKNEEARAKMQGLHGQAREQSLSFSKPGPSPFQSEKAQPVSEEAVEFSASDLQTGSQFSAPETGSFRSSISGLQPPSGERELSPEDLDAGVVGVQPIDRESMMEPPPPIPAEASIPILAVSAPPEPILPPDPEPTQPVVPEPPLPPPMPEWRSTDVIPLFSSLTPEEFTEVVERMIPFQYPAGHRIIKEGDPGDSVYLISQGTVEVMTRIGRREIPLNELTESDFFGEVAFLTGRPRTASVTTKTESEILELRGDDLRATIRKFPRVREVLESFYKSRVRDTLSKIKPPGSETGAQEKKGAE